MFTARVPGLGLVEWTAQQVEDHARELIRTHRRRRGPVQWWRWLLICWPTLADRDCTRCSEPWPCPSAWWADRYQVSQARAITNRHG